MKFFQSFAENVITNICDDLKGSLIRYFEEKNYHNCWVRLSYKGQENIMRLVGYRDGLFSFFDYRPQDNDLPIFLLLKSEEFDLIWIGKGDDYFGCDLEQKMKEVFTYKYDHGFTYCDCGFESGEETDESGDYTDEEEDGLERDPKFDDVSEYSCDEPNEDEEDLAFKY
jgi:hypothetical protein